MFSPHSGTVLGKEKKWSVIHAATQINLENSVLSGLSQTQATDCMTPLMQKFQNRRIYEDRGQRSGFQELREMGSDCSWAQGSSLG